MTSSDTKSIGDPRAEIDAIDAEILELLNRRAGVALRVGAAKTEAEAALCDPMRERQVIERLSRRTAGPLDEQAVANIFARIIDESLLVQQQQFRRRRGESDEATRPRVEAGTRVAILGERGTFSEEAAVGCLGDECETVSCPTFEELFSAVDDGRADVVVSPLENSLIGSVHRSVDLLLQSDLRIAAEIILPVSHFLIGPRGATLESVRTVESHPAALAQCTRFFGAHPDIERIAGNDTASSVRHAVESGDVTRAAIGSRRAASIYGGLVLRSHVEDNSENFTRFVLLTPEDSSAGDKMTLVIRLEHRPGSLHAALRPFVRRGIDMVKIESLPVIDSPGEFNFYLDIATPAIEADLVGALDEIRSEARELRILGRYSTTRLASAADKESI